MEMFDARHKRLFSSNRKCISKAYGFFHNWRFLAGLSQVLFLFLLIFKYIHESFFESCSKVLQMKQMKTRKQIRTHFCKSVTRGHCKANPIQTLSMQGWRVTCRLQSPSLNFLWNGMLFVYLIIEANNKLHCLQLDPFFAVIRQVLVLVMTFIVGINVFVVVKMWKKSLLLCSPVLVHNSPVWAKTAMLLMFHAIYSFRRYWLRPGQNVSPCTSVFFCAWEIHAACRRDVCVINKWAKGV